MWDSLGEKFKKKSDVVIAKIDATKNEVDGVQISEFPSFIFFPRNSDEVGKFDILSMIAVFLYAFTNYLASIILQEQRQCCLVETDMSLE